MTNQEIFNKVWERAKIKEKSYNRGCNRGLCKYRGFNRSLEQTSCFVGYLIPDNLYTKEIEERTIHYFRSIHALDSGERKLVEILTKIGINTSQFKFLSSLQTIHDSVDMEIWEEHLRVIAFTYGLEVPKDMVIEDIVEKDRFEGLEESEELEDYNTGYQENKKYQESECVLC